MLRLAFVLVAVLAATGAWVLKSRSAGSSFGGYSTAQLDTLERGYRVAMQRPPVRPGVRSVGARDSIDAEISLGFLEEERMRRRLFLGAVAVALLGAIGAALPRRGVPRDRGEEGRLAEALGSPEVLLEGERQKAARLLGVSLDAPPTVIDAALQAQLASRDAGRMVGLAPDLQRLVVEQRVALQRARDLLVSKPGPRT